MASEPLIPLGYGGPDTRPDRRWVAVGVVAYGVAVLWLIVGLLLVLMAGLQALELAWPDRQRLPPPRPLTAAEADAVLSALRTPLTPPQLDTLRRQVQLPGQRLVETRAGMPWPMQPPSIGTGRPGDPIIANGGVDDCSTSLTIDVDGRVTASTTVDSVSRDEQTTTYTDAAGHTTVHGYGQHAYDRPTRRRAAVIAALAMLANVALARRLLTLARRIARASDTVRRWAGQYAVVLLFTVAIATVALVSEFAVVNRPATGLSAYERAAVADVIIVAVLTSVFPAGLLVAVWRSGSAVVPGVKSRARRVLPE